jgi:5-methyltetrahydropteroyltriglutamate--homocysteine methyltransferase
MAKRPSDMTFAVHMCRGNLNAFWGAEGGYDPVAEATFGKIDADRYLLEYDTPRAGDFKPLAKVPKGKHVLLGLVSTKDPKLESADGLKRRIDDAAKSIPVDQLGICPQCGFSTNMFGTSFTEDDEKRKLELLVKVATDVWGTA